MYDNYAEPAQPAVLPVEEVVCGTCRNWVREEALNDNGEVLSFIPAGCKAEICVDGPAPKALSKLKMRATSGQGCEAWVPGVSLPVRLTTEQYENDF